MGWKDLSTWTQIVIIWLILSILFIVYSIIPEIIDGMPYLTELKGLLGISLSILIFSLVFSFISKKIYYSKQLNYWIRAILIWFVGSGLITLIIFIQIITCDIFFEEYYCRGIGYGIFFIPFLIFIFSLVLIIYFIIKKNKD